MMINRKFSNRSQQGFTLVELMVGLVVGLIVVGGSLAMFLSTLNSSSNTLKMTKLNQDLTSVMQLMVNEVRRAGYTSDRQLTPTAPLLFDSASNCFIYSYDDDGNASTAHRSKGFRLHNGVLLMNDAPGSCASINSGDALTDSASMTVSAFAVDVTNYKCIKLDKTVVNCAGAVAPYITIREIQITITAQSATDSSIYSTINESVRVRNDLFTLI